MKTTLSPSNVPKYSWYACKVRKEILIGPSGYGDCGDYRELGELGTEPEFLTGWASFAVPCCLMEEGRQVRDYFNLSNYSILYGKP